MTLNQAIAFLLDEFRLGDADMVAFAREQALERDPEFQGNSWEHPHVEKFNEAVKVLKRRTGRIE